MIIQVKNLVKRYKKAQTYAVDGISFTVNKGAFFALLGPNGAGKTTTVSILTTTLEKTSGEVKIAGYDLDKDQSNVRRSIGVIFQNPSLDQNLTAEENIRFHAVLYGIYTFKPFFSMMPDDYKKRVRDLAAVLGIEKDLFKPIKTFSGGMKRKLEIVRSLIHHPKVLFLDEPTSGLDPLSRRNLWEYLQDIRKKENTTIFLTTHYLDEAEGADTVCVINHGKIVSLGTPSKIKQNLVDEYLLINAKDRKRLTDELKKLKIRFNLDQDQNFKINLAKHNSQKLISAIGTPLTYLKTHIPTLEEAYFEIIDHKEEENQ